jgi:hypothetical protein
VRLARLLSRLAVLAVVTTSTVALSHHSTTAAFTGRTGDTANSVTAASSFCAVPGGTTLSVLNDTYVDQAAPATQRGGSATLRVGAGTGAVAHALLRFTTLPTMGHHCRITGATLRLHATSSQGPGPIQVRRASTTWTSAGATWSMVGRPGPAGATAIGTAAGATGWHEWDVKTLVDELYATAPVDDGFLVQDSVETGAVRATVYQSLDAPTVAYRPQLVLSWG